MEENDGGTETRKGTTDSHSSFAQAQRLATAQLPKGAGGGATRRCSRRRIHRLDGGIVAAKALLLLFLSLSGLLILG
ncbi:hypothetical protein Q8G41_27390, partial [Klebsiella pneumoniae]|uniref:hypothetical protein n=1 Tax=Klebsiella pneumoniae TaxID=573 RepID=UPI0030138398